MKEGKRLLSPAALAMAGLTIIALAVRLPFFPYAAYTWVDPPLSDAAVWELWSRTLWQHGLGNISVIEPRTYVGYHYVFWAVAEVYGHFFSPDFELGTRSLLYLEKTPPLLFDLLLIPLLFYATRGVARQLPTELAAARRFAPLAALERRGLAVEDTLGLTAAAVFAFSPGVIYDSAVWAQSDCVISFFMLAAMLSLAAGRVGPAWALWAVAFVIKPQPVVIVPTLVAFTFWRFGWHGLLRGATGAVAGGTGMLGYFLVTGNGPYIWDVYGQLFQTYDQHISINAWNLWWIGQLHGLRASDAILALGPLELTVNSASFLLLVLSTLAALSYLHVRRDLVGLLVASSMLEFAFYLFPISTHERYLYPFFVFLAPIVVLQPKWLTLYVPLSAIFFLNIFFASPSDPDIFGRYLLSDFGQVMAGLNVAAFVATATVLVLASWRVRPWPSPLRPSSPEPVLSH